MKVNYVGKVGENIRFGSFYRSKAKMKKIPLTQGKFALVDDEDFEWLSQWKWTYDGKHGYAKKNFKDKKVYMHRLILDTPQGMDTDHIDLNNLNNQRKNLRIATHSQNGMNRSIQSNNTTGFCGTRWNKQNRLWEARIKINRKELSLGLYNNKIEAGIAYNWAAQKYFGEFANFNNIPNWREIYPIKYNRHFNKRKDNISKLVGISYEKNRNRWRVRVTINRKRINFGNFIDRLDAIKAYNEAIKKYYNDFIKLNKI